MFNQLSPNGTEAGDEVVSVEHLRVDYGATVAVDDVSFAIRRGEIFGILGPNGAGKTTTVECIGGLRHPAAGKIRVLGCDPLRDRNECHQRVGIQLQEAELPDKLRVGEALELFASFYRTPADLGALTGMLGLSDRLDVPFGKLSGGQRQRLSIALALVGRPQVAVLDELTTGLDPQARRDTWSLIESVRDEGVTVILVTHLMEEAERLCDRVALLDRGRLVAIDTPAAIAAGAGAPQQIQFRSSAPVDEAALRALDEVSELVCQGDRVVVSGTGDLVGAVTAVLVAHGIVPREFRVKLTTLEDAFVALTGRGAHDEVQAQEAVR